MTESFLVELLANHPSYAIFISLLINIVVAILGVIPSFFITLANVAVFGLYQGFLISLLGEALGAIVSFWLYRKGLKKVSSGLLSKYKRLEKLVNSENRQAFMLVVSTRLLPFFPSGLITYAAAIGKMNIISFSVASTVGKIPAMAIEVLGSISVVYAAKSGYISVVLAVVGIIIMILALKKGSGNAKN